MDVGVPESWRGLAGGALCTFVSEGWNECVAFEAIGGEPSMQLVGWGIPGQPIEVWLVDYTDGGTDEPLALIATLTFPATAMDGPIRVAVVGSSATDLDVAASDIAAGTVRLEPRER